MEKKLWLVVLLFGLLVGTSNVAWAQAETPTVSPEMQRLIRQEIRRLSGEAGDEEVSAVGVADRALDMIETFAARATAAMESIAPEAWRILVRQQYVEGVLRILIPLMLLFLVAAFWKIMSSSKSLDEEGKFWFGGVLPIVAFLVVGIALAICVPNGIAHFINPEFYAIQDILEALRPATGR